MCPAMSVVHRVGIAKAERRVNPDGLAPRRMVSSWGRSGLYTQPTISAATMGRSAEARLVRHHSHTRRAMLRWWTWKGASGSVGIGLQNSGRSCVKNLTVQSNLFYRKKRKVMFLHTEVIHDKLTHCPQVITLSTVVTLRPM